MKEKNRTSEEEDTGFCYSEDHMEDKNQHSYGQKNTKGGQEKKLRSEEEIRSVQGNS